MHGSDNQCIESLSSYSWLVTGNNGKLRLNDFSTESMTYFVSLEVQDSPPRLLT